MNLADGVRLGRYAITAKLGEGPPTRRGTFSC
jgi:hypothetical protein